VSFSGIQLLDHVIVTDSVPQAFASAVSSSHLRSATHRRRSFADAGATASPRRLFHIDHEIAWSGAPATSVVLSTSGAPEIQEYSA